jgi:transposase-like protein
MVMGERTGAERSIRRRNSVEEKRCIVELTFRPGPSAAQVAQASGVNANQVSTWRRAFERGELVEAATAPSALLPVIVAGPGEAAKEVAYPGVEEAPRPAGVIHIEFPGRAMISVENGAENLDSLVGQAGCGCESNEKSGGQR